MSEKDKISNCNWYKYCFVPECKNTTITDPEKVFVCVPENALKRKAWCEAVGYPSKKLRKSSHCCEDHFNLKEDLENYLEWKMLGSRKRFKAGIVPHLLLRTSAIEPQSVSCKELPSEVMDCAEISLPNISCSGPEGAMCTVAHLPSISTTFSEGVDITSSITSKDVEVDSSALPAKVNHIMCKPARTISAVPRQSIEWAKEVEHAYVQAKPETRVKSTQTDKEVQIKVSNRNIGVTCDIIQNVLTAVKKLSIHDVKSDDTIESICSITSDSSIFIPSNETRSTCTEEKILIMKTVRSSVYDKFTKFVIEDNPSLFIGVTKESMYLIDLVHKFSNISVRNIYLTLRKIKTNQSFSALGYEFNLSKCQASKVFKTSVHTIGKLLKQLILWPNKTDILLNLPLQFRYRYSEVQSTIDCFEIEIEKPSNAVNQALTWSDYKKCNTAKYLISVTPDGLINFISEGACGRCTDMAIVENSGYLDKLPPNTLVLADRGFKQLDVLLNKKQCKLIRPPSVKQDVKSTKKEVKLTKQIASIRIHVERVINRIRNFQFLNIHTRVDNNLLDCLDSCVIIAAALVNTQSEIIKQS